MLSTTFTEYQNAVRKYRLPTADHMYILTGFVGEVGEFYGKIAKAIRDQHKVDIEEASKEIGDIMWFVSALADDLDLHLGEIAKQNIDKLEGRHQRGVIQGNGDNR